MTFADKLLVVANNRPKLYKKGALDYSPQETVSGETIGITDISPIEHNMGVKVKGKNLIPYPYFDKTTTVGDITFTDNGDGGITINGTAGSTTLFFYLTDSNGKADIGDLFEDGKTYKISSIRDAVFVLMCKSLVDGKDKYYYGGNTFTVDKSTYKYLHLRLQVTNKTIDNVTIYPMIEEGTTATSYAPYIGDISAVKLYKGGKNLVSNDVYDINNWVNPSGNTYRYYFNLPVGTYTVSAEKKETVAYFYLQETTDDWVTAKSTYIITDNANNRITFTVEKGKQYAFYTQKQYFALIYNLQIEVGSSYTQYEPYIEPTVYDVSSSGIVDGVNSIYPSVYLYTDTSGAVIDCTYYQDGRKVKENLTDMILSLGGVINE